MSRISAELGANSMLAMPAPTGPAMWLACENRRTCSAIGQTARVNDLEATPGEDRFLRSPPLAMVRFSLGFRVTNKRREPPVP